MSRPPIPISTRINLVDPFGQAEDIPAWVEVNTGPMKIFNIGENVNIEIVGGSREVFKIIPFLDGYSILPSIEISGKLYLLTTSTFRDKI